MTLPRPRTTGRMLRGSALGLGLLVTGGITAPAAFAIEEPTDGTSTDTPEAAASSPLVPVPAEVAARMAPALEGDFGTGKEFTLSVRSYGPVPRDLDLSGAVFQATPQVATDEPDILVGDSVGYTCTTDVDGTCVFDTPRSMSPGEFFPRPFTADGIGPSIPTDATGAALAATGTPVGTIALLGGGLLVLGGGALAAGTIPRRRARRGA